MTDVERRRRKDILKVILDNLDLIPVVPKDTGTSRRRGLRSGQEKPKDEPKTAVKIVGVDSALSVASSQPEPHGLAELREHVTMEGTSSGTTPSSSAASVSKPSVEAPAPSRKKKHSKAPTESAPKPLPNTAEASKKHRKYKTKEHRHRSSTSRSASSVSLDSEVQDELKMFWSIF
ncbi:unnamed protein product [Cyprideis torosa]|uniref:Uncharacterized protein n=1 Tax=Cyprideis torosa TaxID=163714 RepID=A0A7R8WFB7_9CRUS|nr:unnamed protein product [Cyprideis torosa]CAG0896812.1 unnamed protein product [Cyprideis torosa]